jgi:hypothetical protein
MNLRDRIAPVRGIVVAEAHDAAGRLVSRRTFHNAFCDAYATLMAQLLAGTAAPSLALTSMGLGRTGRTISACEAVTGWSNTPTADTTTFREGAASLQGTVAADGTTTWGDPDALTVEYDASADTHVEVWLRLLLRGRFDLTACKLLIYTGSTVNDHWDVTFEGIETANGTAFQDGVWKLCRIPKASFTGVGTPDWAHVSGAALTVHATAAGTATLNWDDVRIYSSAWAPDHADIWVPNQLTTKALSTLTLDAATRTITATAYWTMAEACGVWYAAGLWGNAGNTLCSILAFPHTKAPGLSLTLTWTITTSGG